MLRSVLLQKLGQPEPDSGEAAAGDYEAQARWYEEKYKELVELQETHRRSSGAYELNPNLAWRRHQSRVLKKTQGPRHVPWQQVRRAAK